MHAQISRDLRDRPIALQRQANAARDQLIGVLLRSGHSSGDFLSARTASWLQGLRQTRDGSSPDTIGADELFWRGVLDPRDRALDQALVGQPR
jgi:hypothetical protein